ncbi:MAG TPA: Do family serine endopeptidase [Methylomirabilota bacterium]|jgi:serine protease Do
MRRSAGLILILALVAGALWATDVVTVKINPPTARDVSAAPFWREVSGEATVPPALRIWVDLAKAARPAVVNVSTTQRGQARGPDEFFRRFFERSLPRDEPRARQSLGSGVIASSDGYVVTNFHVVRGADAVVVRLADQSEYQAKLVGSDSRTDLALLKVDGRELPAMPFGDSDRLEVGDPVMAIGNPFGLDQTVTTGIVSAKERFIGSGPYDDFIQTDASVNPGNSGGPLVDVRGALVGINTAIFSQTGGSVGIGFAIPVNIAKDVLRQLRETGKVVRGYLGVAVAPVTPEARRAANLASSKGALVAEVVSGSPAAAAGVRPGDVIVRFQGEELQDPRDLTRRVAATPPGTSVRLQVVRRAGERAALDARVGELKETRAAEGG